MGDIQKETEELTGLEAMRQLALIAAMKKRLAVREKALRSKLEDRMDAGETEEIGLNGIRMGTVELTKGSSTVKWTVKDPEKWAEWLISHGHESLTRETHMPSEEALESAVVSAMVREAGGEMPGEDTVKASGSAPTVRVKLAKDWSEWFDTGALAVPASQALGISGIKESDGDEQ